MLTRRLLLWATVAAVGGAGLIGSLMALIPEPGSMVGVSDSTVTRAVALAVVLAVSAPSALLLEEARLRHSGRMMRYVINAGVALTALACVGWVAFIWLSEMRWAPWLDEGPLWRSLLAISALALGLGHAAVVAPTDERLAARLLMMFSAGGGLAVTIGAAVMIGGSMDSDWASRALGALMILVLVSGLIGRTLARAQRAAGMDGERAPVGYP